MDLNFEIYSLLVFIRGLIKKRSDVMFLAWQRFVQRKGEKGLKPDPNLSLIQRYIEYENSYNNTENFDFFHLNRIGNFIPNFGVNQENHENEDIEENDEIEENEEIEENNQDQNLAQNQENLIINHFFHNPLRIQIPPNRVLKSLRISGMLRKFLNVHFYTLPEKDQFSFIIKKSEKLKLNLPKLVYYMKPECLMRLFCKSNFNFSSLKSTEDVHNFFEPDQISDRNYYESLLELSIMKNEELFEKFKSGILLMLKRKGAEYVVVTYPWIEKILDFLIRDGEEFKNVDLKKIEKRRFGRVW